MVVSNTKLEYMAWFWTSRKAQWIRRLLPSSYYNKKTLYNHLYNQSAITLIENLKLHTRSKH
jgi:hypothetical protein